jgi:tetratricopeptide (TPR) repeat protein
MLSYNRNKRSAAKSLSLLIAGSLLTTAAAQAAEAARNPLVLTAYYNGVGGTDLLNGKYDTALADIQKYKPQMSLMASAKATNLCVALAATKQLTEAKTACDAALKMARDDKLSSSRFTPGTSHDNAYIAVAYANRAVVHMLSHDEASAKADLEKAQGLAPSADFVARNVAAVSSSSSSTIAQLDVTPSR